MLSIAFAPMFPWPVIGALGGLGALMLLYAVVRRGRGTGWRTLVLAILVTALANPVLVEEDRIPIPDTALVVVDESPSQRIGDRQATTERALAEVRAKLDRLPDLEYTMVRAGSDRKSVV